MNTETFDPSVFIPDPNSVGFSVQESANLLLKKFLWRTNTGAHTPIVNEPLYKPNIFPEQVVSDSIPDNPPDDFVTLDNWQIASQFGIEIEEIGQFHTTINGLPSFSIQRSAAYPHIYKINNCLLRPWPSNPSITFTAITSNTKVNLLQNAIPFMFKNGTWRGKLYRTSGSGALSRNGLDTIKETQFAYIFDYDSGFFTSYEKDCYNLTDNTVESTRPPAISCYIYRGMFGNLSPWKYVSGSSGDIYYNGSVAIGKSAPASGRLLDVAGVGFIDSVLTTSLETYSDRRLKENIVVYNNGSNLYNVLNLDTYTYNYIKNPENTEIGLIAQEVEKIVPEIVKEHNGMKTVQYDRIGILLLPIAKEQQTRIRLLESEINQVKVQLSTLLRKLF